MNCPIQDLLQRVKQAPSSALKLSRRDCHLQSVSSIVVSTEEGRLTRAFLAFPGHRLWENRVGHSFPVGPHNHKYPISLTLIYGNVYNDVYVQTLAQYGDSFCTWKYRSGVNDPAERRLEYQGESLLTLYKTMKLPAPRAGRVSLSEKVLHTISTDDNGIAGWWVEEGFPVQEETDLFTLTKDIDFVGLYGSFHSSQEVIDHVELWANIATGVETYNAAKYQFEQKTNG